MPEVCFSKTSNEPVTRTYKLIVLLSVSDWLTGTFIDGSGLLVVFGHP